VLKGLLDPKVQLEVRELQELQVELTLISELLHHQILMLTLIGLTMRMDYFIFITTTVLAVNGLELGVQRANKGLLDL
jgi:hypothetical protein